MVIDLLLPLLDRVRKTGHDRWTACCPAHGDRSPSLSVRELDDGRVLLHCFAGCDVQQVVGAVGLELSDLYPPRPMRDDLRPPRERRPFYAEDALRLIDGEVQAAALAILAAGTGEISPDQRAALLDAANAIQTARETCSLRGVA